MDWTKKLEVIEKFTTILVLGLGGFGAYYKFLRGRIFKPRLQLGTGGKVVRDGAVTCLMVTMQIKNVGVSAVEFNNKGTLINVFSYGPDYYEPEPHLAMWQPVDSFRIFESQEWIESGEIVNDALLIAIPPTRQVAFKVEMVVNARGISFKDKLIIEWQTPKTDKQQRKDDDHDGD